MLHRRQEAAPAFGDEDGGAMHGQSTTQALQRGLHAGHQVVGEEQTPRVHAQSRQSQGIFLHGVALVFKQHHHHGNAQQHLGHRAKQTAGVAKHFRPGILQLPHAHQHGPQRQRNGEHLEGQRSALVAVQVEDRRAIQQDRSQAQTQSNCGLHVGAEHAVHDVPPQREAGERHADRSDRGVVPAETIGAAHQARRNENAQRHRDQEKLADKKRNRRLRKRIEDVVQRVSGPGQLPRAEVRLPALLVQISKDEKQQNRDKSRNQNRRDNNTVHRVGEDTSGQAFWLSFGGKQWVNVFIPSRRTQ